ncbi:peroxisome proliferator-activated receptor gamma coactivator-related protein 1-like [Saccostrea echinata]|uniref:peroxisome proliferator-activated receptor gamma coactivator-related protein 1-like n=1 Tax=Saccostrea echinata TaxID=191078 RepID=UPI002A8024EA|nr:peroxisome proliferator-activated receptor gamma coactivator-related protein 1-like [Saccostrea echinata]
MALHTVMTSLAILEMTINGVSGQFAPFPGGFQDPWGPQSFRRQFPSPVSNRMQPLTARRFSSRNPPSRQPDSWGQPWRQPSPPFFDQNARQMARRNSVSVMNPAPNQASGIDTIASLLLNSTSQPGAGLSPQQILSQVQSLNSPGDSSNGLSQILNFGKSLLEGAFNTRKSVKKESPIPPSDVTTKEIKTQTEKINDNVQVPKNIKNTNEKQQKDIGSVKDKVPNNVVVQEEISGPISPSDVKQVNEAVNPIDNRPTDFINPVDPVNVNLENRPTNPIDIRPIDGSELVGLEVLPSDAISPRRQINDRPIIHPEDGIHRINPITGLPEFSNARPVTGVSPGDVVDHRRGHLHTDGTFHDFPATLHGNDTHDILSVLDPVTGETAVFPAIDFNADKSQKDWNPAENRAAWLRERKRVRRLRKQNQRLRELLRQHMNEVHPSELVPVNENGLKPGDVIPVIPVVPDYIPSATPSPNLVFPNDPGVNSGNPVPEPEPILPGIPLGPQGPQPGDAIPVGDVIPEPEVPGYIPAATPSPVIKVPGEKKIPPVTGGKKPLQPGDFFPVDDVIPTLPGYIPSATPSPVLVVPKDIESTYPGVINPPVNPKDVLPVKPKVPDTFILPATPAPVIKVPPTTKRPQPPPPPPPPRRPPPPPPKKSNNLLKNLGIGFALGSLFFGK